MTMVLIPAREVPIPAHLSLEAQGMLAMGPMGGGAQQPAFDDLDGWRANAAMTDEMMLPMISMMVANVEAASNELDVDGVRVYEAVPPGLPEGDRRVYLSLHGGGFVAGAGECCRIMGLTALASSRVRTWSPDYRMPPDHPYPAALDDCLTVYRALLVDHRPEEIIVGGGSAGGNLAAALMLRARDAGLPPPAALVLTTPEVDLTESGDSNAANLGLDTVLTGSLMQANLLYANGVDLSDPYLSPLFGDVSTGFPPTLLTSGTRDLFLSNTVRMHRKLRADGVPAELHLLEAGGHAGFFGMAPEDHELGDEVRRFIDAHWPQATDGERGSP